MSGQVPTRPCLHGDGKGCDDSYIVGFDTRVCRNPSHHAESAARRQRDARRHEVAGRFPRDRSAAAAKVVAWQVVDKAGVPVDWQTIELDRHYQIDPGGSVRRADRVEPSGAPHRARPLVYRDEP